MKALHSFDTQGNINLAMQCHTPSDLILQTKNQSNHQSPSAVACSSPLLSAHDTMLHHSNLTLPNQLNHH